MLGFWWWQTRYYSSLLLNNNPYSLILRTGLLLTNLIFWCIFYNMKKRLSVGLVILINAMLLAVIVSVVVAMNFPDSSPTEPQKQPAEESHTPIPVPATESSVLEIVNKERAKVGLPL